MYAVVLVLSRNLGSSVCKYILFLSHPSASDFNHSGLATTREEIPATELFIAMAEGSRMLFASQMPRFCFASASYFV